MKDKEFRMSTKTLILPLFLILLCCVFGCRNKHHTEKNETAHDLPQIKDSGELVVLTLYSSTSYFIYRGQEMGFQYELSEQFAKSLGLKLRIEVARNVRELIQKLQSGEGDRLQPADYQRMERQPFVLRRRHNHPSGYRPARKWKA